MQNPPFLALQRGALFHGRYRVIRRIKAGGMGAVYEAVDERTGVRRALKVMLPSLVEDAEMHERFALEARITADIESDHLVRVSDAGVDVETGTPFLVMDLLRGEDLGTRLAERGPLTPAEVVLFLRQAALALDKTHAAGIVHRDLKPENLFVTTRDDGSPCVKILDFGVAKLIAHTTNAKSTRSIGSPMYMAPEQVQGDGRIGPAADIYALGQMAYTLLVGEPYWHEESKSLSSLFPLFVKILFGAQEPPSERAARRRGVRLPRAFDGWYRTATAVRPEERFEHASAAALALAEALGLAPRASLPPSESGSRWPAVRRDPSGEARRGNAAPAGGGTTDPTVSRDAPRTEARRTMPRALVVAGIAGAVIAAALFVRVVVRDRPRLPSSSNVEGLGQPGDAPAPATPAVEADGVITTPPPARALGSEPGRLTIACSPLCDRIAVDGIWLRRRVVDGEFIEPGEHRVTLQRGTERRRLVVKVKPGQLTRVSLEGDELSVPKEDDPPDGAGDPKEDVDSPDDDKKPELGAPSPPPPETSGYARQRKALEPKVWAGNATVEEVKLLRAICSHMGDRACRDRANAMLQQKEQNEAPSLQVAGEPEDTAGHPP